MNKVMRQIERGRRKFARATAEAGQAQQQRLIGKIESLGGRRPDPWPWAVVKVVKRKGEQRIIVDTALYNLQLLETVEKLQEGKAVMYDWPLMR